MGNDTQTSLAELMLLAMDDLPGEFTEWDATVATWRKFPKRCSMPGYDYPDHKRLYVELLKSRRCSTYNKGYVEKVGTNRFRLTDLGRAKIAELRNPELRDHYAFVKTMLVDHSFKSWVADPSQPRKFPAGFFAQRKIVDVRKRVEDLMTLCTREKFDYVPGDGAPIHVARLSDVLDFITMCQHRFSQK